MSPPGDRVRLMCCSSTAAKSPMAEFMKSQAPEELWEGFAEAQECASSPEDPAKAGLFDPAAVVPAAKAPGTGLFSKHQHLSRLWRQPLKTFSPRRNQPAGNALLPATKRPRHGASPYPPLPWRSFFFLCCIKSLPFRTACTPAADSGAGRGVASSLPVMSGRLTCVHRPIEFGCHAAPCWPAP